MSDDHYIIRGGRAGRERLRLLSRVMEPLTRALLDRVRVARGARCLDVGCGGGDVTLMLARLVGPEGRVVGVDIDDAKLELAREEADAARVSNVEYRRGSIDDVDPDGSFDVVYARFLFSHLPDPTDALRRMIAFARPAGVVAVEDVDFSGCFCYPENIAYRRFCDLYVRAGEARGVDATVGRRLPALFAGAQMGEIGIHIGQPAGFDADTRLGMPLTLEYIEDAVVSSGLASREEMAALVSDLYAFAAEPTSILGWPRMVQVWGTATQTRPPGSRPARVLQQRVRD
jgi:2-polyprenyl-3-methyl-5-hydroxy-6-metoxy-1,4-benzoquinol methylase